MPNSLPVYKLFYCPYKGCEISAVGARQCNYSNLDNYTCTHTGESCVAKAGLEAFAQSLAESIPITSLDSFQKMKELVEQEKREATIANIIRLVDPKYLSETEKRNLPNTDSHYPKK